MNPVMRFGRESSKLSRLEPVAAVTGWIRIFSLSKDRPEVTLGKRRWLIMTGGSPGCSDHASCGDISSVTTSERHPFVEHTLLAAHTRNGGREQDTSGCSTAQAATAEAGSEFLVGHARACIRYVCPVQLHLRARL